MKRFYVSYELNGEILYKVGNFEQIESFIKKDDIEDINIIEKTPQILNSLFIKKRIEQKELELIRLKRFLKAEKRREEVLKEELPF